MFQVSTNSAPSLGPIIGGVLAETVSWHWIFWLLAIISGTNLLILSLIMPETGRRIVDNGSLRPPRPINRPLFPILTSFASRGSSAELAQRRAIRFPNPLNRLTTLLQRASFLVSLVGGIQYTVYGCLAASFSTLMIRLYDLNYLTGGLIYLPCGIGGVLAAYSTGKLLDRDYIRTAKRYDLPVDKSTNNLSNFPIEQARLQSVFPLLAISTMATVGFGWALNQHTSIAIPLTLLQRRISSGHLHGMWHAPDRSEPETECHCPSRLQFYSLRTECRRYSWFAGSDRCDWSRLVLYILRHHWCTLHINLCIVKKSRYAMADRISGSERLCSKNRTKLARSSHTRHKSREIEQDDSLSQG